MKQVSLAIGLLVWSVAGTHAADPPTLIDGQRAGTTHAWSSAPASGSAQAPAGPANHAPGNPDNRDLDRVPFAHAKTFVYGAGTPHTSPIENHDQPVALTIGPQRLAYDSLIHQEREHRGAVAAWELGDGTQVKGFGVGPDTARDSTRLTGQADDAYRLSGLLVEHALQAPHQSNVNLRFGWVSGHEPTSKARARRSAGWSVAGDAALLSERLRLRAEYAASRLASNDSPTAAGLDADGAYRLGFELRAPAAAPVDWHLGSEFSEVAPGFRSLGNPSMPRDRTQLRTYGGARLGDWQLELGLLRRRDNLVRDPSRPVVLSDRLKAATTWKPAQPAVSRTVGSPTYRLAAEIGGSRTLVAGDCATDQAERRRAIRLSLGSEFSQAELRWGMRAKAGVAPGRIGEVDSPAIRALAFEMYGELGDGWLLPVKPTLSWQRRRDVAGDAADERWRAKLASPSIDLRHDLHGGFDMAFEHHDRPGLEDDALGTDLGARLVWTLQRPSANRRGLALAVAGSLASSGTAPDDEGDYRLVVSLSTDESLVSW